MPYSDIEIRFLHVVQAWTTADIVNNQPLEDYTHALGSHHHWNVRIRRWLHLLFASYDKFHALLSHARPDIRPPKLLICGHGSVDDPDGTIVYDTAQESRLKRR